MNIEINDNPEGDVVVCTPLTTPLLIADNATGQCADCRRMIQFRPHAPKTARKFLCVECAIPYMTADALLVTTPRMLDDFRSYMRKKLQ